jgi:hypothetical protein
MFIETVCVSHLLMKALLLPVGVLVEIDHIQNLFLSFFELNERRRIQLHWDRVAAGHYDRDGLHDDGYVS